MAISRSACALTLVLVACVNPIDIVPLMEGGEVVISGQISSLENQSWITLGTTADIERLPFPVLGASIILYEDGDSIGTYVEEGRIPGRYTLADIIGHAGKAYHIKVTTPDSRTYISQPEIMPGDPGSLSTYFTWANEDYVDGEGDHMKQPFIRLYANASLPTKETRYIQWYVDEVYIVVPTTPVGSPSTASSCFIVQAADPQAIMLLDRQYLTSTEFPDKFLIKRLIDFSFLYKHYFVTHQSALTADAFEYWRKVNVLVSTNGSIFDTPPAKIYGNIKRSLEEATSEKVIGYFQAVNQSVNRISATRDDFPFLITAYDCQGSQLTPPPRCADCLSIRNSSHVRPPWF